ncbi:MAG: helix-turn-helix domain-containing protein [Saccharofermentans sp.]|nr:helix-turn-helix domain-containing protein [Saccharofermentans sp.]
MILADKIINERKKNGWSQEELADKLSVSRQSVSKWEGAQSVPDLNRIIQMAELFNVSLDYLLKDEMEPEVPSAQPAPVESGSPARKVSMEEAVKYIKTIKNNNSKAILGTVAFILSPVTLIMLAGLSGDKMFGITENLAAGIGLLVLFILVALGVILWIPVDKEEKEFEYLKKDDFDSEYGVSGMVKEQLKELENRDVKPGMIAFLLFMFSPAGIIASSLANAPDYIVVAMLCLLFFMIAAGVGITLGNSRIKTCYETLLNEHKDREKMKTEKKLGKVTSIYWTIATVIFLIMGLALNLWKFAGIYWIVAGLLFWAVKTIADAIIVKD